MNRRHFLVSSALATSLDVVRTRAATADEDAGRLMCELVAPHAAQIGAEAFLLHSASGGGATIEAGSKRAEHTLYPVRGALPKWEGPGVYVAGFTRFEFALWIG